MIRSTSGQSWGSSTLGELHEDEEEVEYEDEEKAVHPPVRVISGKAAALLGLEESPSSSTTPTLGMRSLPMTPASSKEAQVSPKREKGGRLQRVESQEENKGARMTTSGSGSGTGTVHTYAHDPLPPFPCTLVDVLEYEV